MTLLRSIAAAGLFASVVFVPAQASQTPKAESNPDPIFVFNRICYTKIHDLESIKSMALELAWRLMDKADLQQFKSYEDPSVLEGWDVQVGERLFRLGITQAGLSDKMKETFPDFAKGTVKTCSLILDDQQDAAMFMPNMQRLAGKEPVSKDVPEGPLLTTTWAGGNDELKVFLFAKVPPSGAGGLLNVTLIQK